MSSKKEDIVKATIKLFYERGLNATPMSAIAQEANVGMGTIYNYFPTKEKLINELFLVLKEKQARYILFEFEKLQNTSVKTRLMAIWGRIIDYYMQHTQEAVLFEQLLFLPVIAPETHAQGKEFYTEVFHVYGQGQAEGIIKSASKLQLAYFVKGGLANIAKFCLANGLEITPEIREIALQSAWDAARC